MRTRMFLFFLLLMLSLSPTRPATAASCGSTYTVQPGETLVSIAKKCGLNHVVLTNINYELSDPNKIYPGQVIRLTAEVPLSVDTNPITTGPRDLGMQMDGQTYIARRGDSLARIAYLYNTSVGELLRVNPQLNNRAVITPGQVIQMPPDASHAKGWVGVDRLTAPTNSQIQVKTADFPPNAKVDFILRYKEPGSGYYSDPDRFKQENYQVKLSDTTDLAGRAFKTLTVPYWAYRNETWVVEVHTTELTPQITAVSPDVVIAGNR